jgi:hypothetical protein
MFPLLYLIIISVLKWEAYDVASWLCRVGLAKFANAFAKREINGIKLIEVTDEMLHDLGLDSFDREQFRKWLSTCGLVNRNTEDPKLEEVKAQKPDEGPHLDLLLRTLSSLESRIDSMFNQRQLDELMEAIPRLHEIQKEVGSIRSQNDQILSRQASQISQISDLKSTVVSESDRLSEQLKQHTNEILSSHQIILSNVEQIRSLNDETLNRLSAMDSSLQEGFAKLAEGQNALQDIATQTQEGQQRLEESTARIEQGQAQILEGLSALQDALASQQQVLGEKMDFLSAKQDEISKQGLAFTDSLADCRSTLESLMLRDGLEIKDIEPLISAMKENRDFVSECVQKSQQAIQDSIQSIATKVEESHSSLLQQVQVLDKPDQSEAILATARAIEAQQSAVAMNVWTLVDGQRRIGSEVSSASQSLTHVIYKLDEQARLIEQGQDMSIEENAKQLQPILSEIYNTEQALRGSFKRLDNFDKEEYPKLYMLEPKDPSAVTRAAQFWKSFFYCYSLCDFQCEDESGHLHYLSHKAEWPQQKKHPYFRGTVGAPKEFIKKLSPALKHAYFILKIGAVAAHLAGIPVPDLSVLIPSEVMDEFKDALIEAFVESEMASDLESAVKSGSVSTHSIARPTKLEGDQLRLVQEIFGKKYVCDVLVLFDGIQLFRLERSARWSAPVSTTAIHRLAPRAP